MSEHTPTLVWQKPLHPIGPEEDPEQKLFGHVLIGGTDFHAEAVEVYYDEEGEQISKQEPDNNYLDEVLAIVQGNAQTITINGREYVLFLTPYQR